MKLKLENGKSIENPSDFDIRRMLDTIGVNGNEFAILSQSKKDFIQTAGSKDTGFVLEWHRGTTEEHEQTLDTKIDLDSIKTAFTRYHQNKSDWKDDFSWKVIQLKQKPKEDFWWYVSATGWILIIFFAANYLIRKVFKLEFSPLFGEKADILMMGYAVGLASIQVFRTWENQDIRSKSIVVMGVFWSFINTLILLFWLLK